jgi:hypothetical protein
MAKDKDQATLPMHGGAILPSVEVDSYNLELEDDEGFVGDKASRGAFRRMLDDVRDILRRDGEQDPLGDEDSERISKKRLEALLSKGDPSNGSCVRSHGATRTASCSAAAFVQAASENLPSPVPTSCSRKPMWMSPSSFFTTTLTRQGYSAQRIFFRRGS